MHKQVWFFFLAITTNPGFCLCSLCFIPHHVWLLPAQVMHSMFVGFTVRWCVCTRGWSGCYNQCRAWNMASRWGSPDVAAGDPFWDFTRVRTWLVEKTDLCEAVDGASVVFFFCFFTAMWFQFCLFPSDSAAVQSHPRRTLMVKLVKNMAN